MNVIISRSFTVEAPLDACWERFALVEKWPTWAAHIRSIEVSPPGAVRPQSSGVIHLGNGISTTFRMKRFSEGVNWAWTGKFLWMTIDYDHHFEALDEQRTRMTFMVAAEGPGLSTVGRLFAWQYNRNLDVAIPNLQAEYAAAFVEA